MALEQFAPNFYSLATGPVNVFFLVDGNELTLIDASMPNQAEPILAGIAELGKQPSDLRRIVLTHCHPDHAGSAAAVKQATGAEIYAPALEAAQIRAGRVNGRPVPTPRLMQRILYWLILRNASSEYPPSPVDREIKPGDVLPVAGGLKAIAAPGHSLGHLVFLSPQQGGILFAADACGNMPSLDYSIVNDDFAMAQRTLAQISQLDFAIACFGHGKTISQNAGAHFRKRWRKLQP